jgi:hypothetical protein
MTKEFRESLERLKHAADANVHLASEMAELLELREAVRRTKRGCGGTSPRPPTGTRVEFDKEELAPLAPLAELSSTSAIR